MWDYSGDHWDENDGGKGNVVDSWAIQERIKEDTMNTEVQKTHTHTPNTTHRSTMT